MLEVNCKSIEIDEPALSMDRLQRIGQTAVTEPQPCSVIVRLQFDFDEGRAGPEGGKIGSRRAPSHVKATRRNGTISVYSPRAMLPGLTST